MNKNLLIINRNDFTPVNYDTDEPMRILCCHEEGIYWLKNNFNNKMQLLFNKECLDMTNKWNAYLIFKQNNIPTVKKTKQALNILKFPTIVKPNIGFGSIGVKKINTPKELETYINNFDAIVNESVIAEDKKKFFKNENNFPIYEECIENGQFFSVPFIVDQNKKVSFYPVMGIRKENTSMSNYKWSTFLYGKDIIEQNIREKIGKIINDIAQKWISQPSVNLVEMIYDITNDKMNVLEFSPRLVGGRIAKMIKYALGINLEKISIASFLEIKDQNLNEDSNEEILLDICDVDLTGSESISYSNEELKKYELIDVEEAKSTIGSNTVRYKMYKKKVK